MGAGREGPQGRGVCIRITDSLPVIAETNTVNNYIPIKQS